MARWKELLRKYGKWVGYPLFYLATFVIFLRLFFPYDKIKERIILSFNSQQRSNTAQQQLQIEEIRGWWLTGVRIKNIRLVTASNEPGGAPSEWHIDEARVKVGVLAAIIGHIDASFHIDAFGGEIDGTYEDSSKERVVEAELDGVDLTKIDTLTDLLGLPVEGHAKGTLKLVMPEGHASKGSGTVSLEIADVAIGDGKAKLKNALDWPKLSVGPLTLTAEAKEGVLKLTKLQAGGKDLELSGDGKLQMRDLASESTVDVNMKFKINDSYRSKSKLTEALFGAPGSTRGGDVDRFVPKMKSAHRTDGFYAFKLQGLLGKLEPRPEPSYAGEVDTSGSGGGVRERPMPRERRGGAPEEPRP